MTLYLDDLFYYFNELPSGVLMTFCITGRMTLCRTRPFPIKCTKIAAHLLYACLQVMLAHTSSTINSTSWGVVLFIVSETYRSGSHSGRL